MSIHQWPKNPKDHLFDGGGGGSDDGDMEARVRRLEELAEKTVARLTSIELANARLEEKLDARLPTLATQGDLHREMRDQTWKLVTWMTTIATALVGITYYIAKH